MLRWSEEIQNFFGKFYIQFTDILEVLILAFLIYHILVWVQKTRAWVLFKGLIVIALFLLVALALDMDTILWIAKNILGVAITAVVIILQPELRKALEELGKNGFLDVSVIRPCKVF